MMEVNVLNFEDIQIGVIVLNGMPWFTAEPIAEVLYHNPQKALRKRVDSDDRLTDTDGRTIFINKAGVYALIFASKHPSAKAFKKWFTEATKKHY